MSDVPVKKQTQSFVRWLTKLLDEVTEEPRLFWR